VTDKIEAHLVGLQHHAAEGDRLNVPGRLRYGKATVDRRRSACGRRHGEHPDEHAQEKN
jgi:hypothetical protein